MSTGPGTHYRDVQRVPIVLTPEDETKISHLLPNVQVAVPSHGRAERCNEATLRLLADRGFNNMNVRVFVAPGEVEHYRSTLDPRLYAEVVEGALHLGPQRNYITGWYPNRTPVVHMDDDIVDLRRKVDDKHAVPVEDFHSFFEWAFRLCAHHKTGLWGTYPVLNPMFMGDKVRVGLWYLLGQLWGCINDNDPALRLRVSQKEDYERTLRWYDKYGKVIRLDMVAPKSRMYADGGMQAEDQPDRRAINESAVSYLAAKWPQHVRIKAKKNARIGREIRLAE